MVAAGQSDLVVLYGSLDENIIQLNSPNCDFGHISDVEVSISVVIKVKVWQPY